MKFTKVPETTFQQLQLNAGVLLNTFNPETPVVESASIVGATSGGVKFSAVPTYKDMGEGIDNMPKNMKELKEIESMDIKMNGTFLTVTAETVKTLIGSADIDKADSTKIVPRSTLTDEDFTDIWWVGDYSDKNGESNGGFIAIHMMNALNTAGFSFQSADREKGQFAFDFTAHYSMAAQDLVPFEVYIKSGTEEA